MSFMIDDEIFTEVDRVSYQLDLEENDDRVEIDAIATEDCGVWNYLCSVRFRVCLLLCGAMFTMQYMNISMGMAIISMTVPPPIKGHDPSNHSWDNSSWFHVLDWSPSTQGLILSSLSWGRMFTPFSGFLCDKANAKILIGIGVSVAGVATVLIPTGSQVSALAVMVCRVLIGFGDAIVMPTVNRYIAVWFPKTERNLAVSLSTGGRQLAVIVAFPLAGIMASHQELLGGWPIVFYSAGIFSCFWVPLWLAWANQTPAKHKCISEVEKLRIAQGTDIARMGKDQKIPWKEMLTSGPLISTIFAIVCHEIPVNVIFVFLPTYMRDILHFDIDRNGMLSGIPAIAFLLAKLSSAHLADLWFQKRKTVNRDIVMKVVNTVASLGLGGFLLAASNYTCSDRQSAVTLLALAIGFSGLHTPGCISNLVNIAPAFVGTISGITFFLIGVTSIVNPIVVKLIVKNGVHRQWQTVFYGLATIAFLPVIFFNIWGSSHVQSWGFAYAAPKDPEKGMEQPLHAKTVPIIICDDFEDVLKGRSVSDSKVSEIPEKERKESTRKIVFATSGEADSIGSAAGLSVANSN